MHDKKAAWIEGIKTYAFDKLTKTEGGSPLYRICSDSGTKNTDPNSNCYSIRTRTLMN